jgi:hypothetical protein
MGPGYIMKIMVWIKNPRHTLVPAVVNPTGGNAPTGPGKNAPLATPLQPIHICCTPPMIAQCGRSFGDDDLRFPLPKKS